MLALLHLTSFTEGKGELAFTRAWKGHDWEALDRLHQKGLISDPKNKNKSVALSSEGSPLEEAPRGHAAYRGIADRVLRAIGCPARRVMAVKWRRCSGPAATPSELGFNLRRFPGVGPPPLCPRRSNTGLSDAIPLGLSELFQLSGQGAASHTLYAAFCALPSSKRPLAGGNRRITAQHCLLTCDPHSANIAPCLVRPRTNSLSPAPR